MKKDVQVELARYIQVYGIDEKWKSFYTEWANKGIKDYTQCVQRLH